MSRKDPEPALAEAVRIQGPPRWLPPGEIRPGATIGPVQEGLEANALAGARRGGTGPAEDVAQGPKGTATAVGKGVYALGLAALVGYGKVITALAGYWGRT
jgi:hypothetical protein